MLIPISRRNLGSAGGFLRNGTFSQLARFFFFFLSNCPSRSQKGPSAGPNSPPQRVFVGLYATGRARRRESETKTHEDRRIVTATRVRFPMKFQCCAQTVTRPGSQSSEEAAPSATTEAECPYKDRLRPGRGASVQGPSRARDGATSGGPPEPFESDPSDPRGSGSCDSPAHDQRRVQPPGTLR